MLKSYPQFITENYGNRNDFKQQCLDWYGDDESARRVQHHLMAAMDAYFEQHPHMEYDEFMSIFNQRYGSTPEQIFTLG